MKVQGDIVIFKNKNGCFDAAKKYIWVK